jgi:hypothetical protein
MALATSNTYNFQSIEIELIIREAYERIGITGELVEAQKLESANRSINFLLLEWMNKSINLWTLRTAFLPLVTNQAAYSIPSTVDNIIQINLRTYTRVLNGTPASSSGIAANAFDGNPLTACTQTAVNGFISYNYGANNLQQITFVGIQSLTLQSYTLNIQVSSDNMNWITLLSIPTQSYPAGVIQWFDIPTPIDMITFPNQGLVYQIIETGGATLNIAELYFNNNVYDFTISNISRYEYLTLPNKNLTSRPNTYYYDRQISPNLYIWPTPTPDYNCIQYSYKSMLQDVGNLYTKTLEIPAYFYPPLVAGLTWQLAIKFNPQMAESAKMEYERSFSIATIDNSESTPINIYASWSGTRGGSYL